MTEEFIETPEDVQWLRDTEIRGIDGIPEFSHAIMERERILLYAENHIAACVCILLRTFDVDAQEHTLGALTWMRSAITGNSTIEFASSVYKLRRASGAERVWR